MDEVTLLDRVDTKYVFQARKLPLILSKLSDSYDVLEIGRNRFHHYETLYFDTKEKMCYLNHHNRRMNRFKLRSRKYADTGLCYFEIKIKNNKERTRKERKKHPGPQEVIDGKPAMLLAEITGLTPEMVVPAIRIDFSRVTLVNHELNERVTIDTELEFRNGNMVKSFPGIVIAELKQNRSCSSLFSDILHREHVLPYRISKYCIGMCSLDPDIKQNNFKEKLHYLNKLSHDIR
jgi:hypothetical protein